MKFKWRPEKIRGRLIVLGTQQQVKERRLYYPTKFSELELIVRNNFCAVGGQIRFYESAKGGAELDMAVLSLFLNIENCVSQFI